MRKMVFRPAAKPSVGIPIGARSVGHYIVSAGGNDRPRRKDFVQVFWGVTGTGRIVIDGVEMRFGAGQIALYMPGMVHCLFSVEEEWEYRWWTMDGPFAESVTRGFNLGAGVFDASEAPEELFVELEEGISTPSRLGELCAASVAYRLLSYAAVGARRNNANRYVELALEIIHSEWSNPGLGVEGIAERIGLHRSSLCRQFSDSVGTSPVRYIANLRLQNAMAMLRQGNLTVKEVAYKCGFRSSNYFARIMKNAYGQSPVEFRNG